VSTQLSSDEQARLCEALAAVCREAGIESAGARLVKYTMNAVYRLDHAGVVIRIAPAAMAERVDRVVRAATMFATVAAPVTRLAPGHEHAIHLDDWSASIWTLVPQPPHKTWIPSDLARPMRAIHTIENPSASLPHWNTVEKARQRLAGVRALDEHDHRLMREWSITVGLPLDKIVNRLERWCDQLDDEVGEIQWHLADGVIHGDAHTGNLLVAQNGESLLCDLDSVAIGPREWDLVPAAHGATRFGDDRDWYRTFSAEYGFDITTWSGWDTLRQVRELQLVTSVIASLSGRPAVARQLAHRLRTIFAGDTTVTWQRYQ
jgi:aminoglycoside phosphotransferase (APT) family kinase protein